MNRSRTDLLPVLVPAAGFVAWCLTDLARDAAPRHLPKPVWAAVVLVSTPLGGIAWLTLGRSGQRRSRHG